MTSAATRWAKTPLQKRGALARWRLPKWEARPCWTWKPCSPGGSTPFRAPRPGTAGGRSSRRVFGEEPIGLTAVQHRIVTSLKGSESVGSLARRLANGVSFNDVVGQIVFLAKHGVLDLAPGKAARLGDPVRPASTFRPAPETAVPLGS